MISVVVIIGISWFVKVEIDVIGSTIQNKSKVDQLNKQYEEVLQNCEEKKEIKESIESGDANDEKIIKIIRSHGYVYPDEKVFIDIAGN
ncbi:MAG: hypothetical protein RR640_00115 [Oscillospiraceae bacterium]